MSITATGDLPALTPEAPAAEAARMIAARGVGAVPVQDRDGRVIGLVSERDIVRVVATRSQGIRGLSVDDVMTRDPVAVRPGTPRETALEVMRRVGLRHLPVCCAEGRLVGLMGLEDVARAV